MGQGPKTRPETVVLDFLDPQLFGRILEAFLTSSHTYLAKPIHFFLTVAMAGIILLTAFLS